MNQYETIIYEIRKTMREKKINCIQLGELLGVRRETVSQKLNGYKRLYFWELVEICDYLGLELSVNKKENRESS